MNRHDLAHGRLVVLDPPADFLQGRDIRRRRRRRRPEEVLQDELPTLHRRSAARVRGDHQHRRLRQQSTARTFLGQSHAAEIVALDVRNAVVFGQIFIGKCVVAVQEFQDTAVVAQHVGEDHLRLALHQPAQLADLRVRLPREPVVAQNRPGLNGEVLDVAHLEPLPREILHKGSRASVCEHTLDLVIQIFPQLTSRGQPCQPIVRHGGPEKVGEPRCQAILIKRGARFASGGRLGRLHTKQESRRRQNDHDRLPDPLLECLTRLLVSRLRDGREAIERPLVDGTAKRRRRKFPQDFACVLAAPFRVGWVFTREEPVPILGPLPVFAFRWPRDRDGMHHHVQPGALLVWRG